MLIFIHLVIKIIKYLVKLVFNKKFGINLKKKSNSPKMFFFEKIFFESKLLTQKVKFSNTGDK